MKCLVSINIKRQKANLLTDLWIHFSQFDISTLCLLQVVLCALVGLSVGQSEADGQAQLEVSLPYGFYRTAGAVSSTNVNVPGQFSYSVSSIHPTEDTDRNVNFAVPAGYRGMYNPYLGLRNNLYNPWGLYSMGRFNPYLTGYPFGYNGYSGLALNYPYGGLAYAPVPTVADQE